MTARRARACSVCQRPLTVHEAARGGTCDTLACRSAAEKQRLAQLAQERERERHAQAARRRDEWLAERPDLRGQKVALVVLVGSDQALEPVPAARRERLRAHLQQVLSVLDGGGPLPGEYTNAPGAPPEASPEAVLPPPEQLAQACALCRGYCCAEGAPSAFIEAATLARSRAQRPELSDDDLIAAYLDAIPARSIAGSCVYHGHRGCTLPRDLRARICNEYYCAPVQRWAREADAAGLPPAAVAVIPDREVVRGALVDGDGANKFTFSPRYSGT